MIDVVDAPRSRRRWLWIAPVALLGVLAAAAAAAVVVLRVWFSGPALAERVCAELNADMRGRVSIASIDWPRSAVPRLVAGGWVPVTLRDVEVRDADGIVVLRSASVRAEIDAHAVMFGHHDVIARHVVVEGGDVRLREVAAREPAFAGDTTVSLLAAFESPRPRVGAGPETRDGARFEARDVVVRGVSLAIDALPADTSHLVRVTLSELSTRGSISYDPRRAAPLLTYATTPMTTRGTLAIGDHTIAIERIDVRELRQDGRDARLVLAATLEDGAVLARAATIDATVRGPLDEDPHLDATITGLAYVASSSPALSITLDPIRVTHDLASGAGSVEAIVAHGAGGSVRATAHWSGGVRGTLPTALVGDVAIAEPLDAGPWLRRDVIRELGRHVRGSVHVDVVDGALRVGGPALHTERLTVDAGTLVLADTRHLRFEQLHYRVPGLEGTYDCAADLAPPERLDCTGRWAGDARVLLRLRELDTW